jgi:hypothetical protein
LQHRSGLATMAPCCSLGRCSTLLLAAAALALALATLSELQPLLAMAT